MATTLTRPQAELAPPIRRALESLRRRVRRYVWIEGLAVALAWLGVAFWASLAIDWFFEPTPPVRLAMLVLTGVVLVAVIVQRIGRRAFVPLSDSSMATVLERRFPQLNDHLLTAVILTGRHPDPDECDPEMLARTCAAAAQRIGHVELARVFNPRPLRRGVAAAVLLLASIALLTVLFPWVTGIWARRTLLMADELWPRRTHLAVEGFSDGVVKVARGGELEVLVKADNTMPLVPQTVEIRYRYDGGGRGRALMNRLGNAGPEDPFQFYNYSFRSLPNSLVFDVVGGDDAVRGLRIEVVDSPTIVEMNLECAFPAYMDLGPRTEPVTGVMPIRMGTRVTVVARTNKPLVRVQVDHAAEEEQSSSRAAVVTELTEDRRGFRWALEPLLKDSTLLFTLHDADGIKSREPVRLALVTVPDEPPQLAVRLAGIGTAITPQARVPASGRIADDYGVARLWFETAVDQEKPVVRPIPDPSKNSTELKLDAATEARDLKIKPGQKVLLLVKAADRCTLGKGPNVGASEQWLLEVVTPEQLRSMLQARELVLRQRFEAIIQEVTDTRDLLARIGSGGPQQAAQDELAKDTKQKPDADESGDEPGDEGRRTAGSRAMDVLSVERAIQTSRKNGHETASVAEAFDDIRLQLVNNRIDTEELKRRLAEGIAEPLRNISARMFPELDQMLLKLQAALADEKLAAVDSGPPRQQVERILVEMQKVLGRMLELEDFNEAVELLRAIIKQQEQLNNQTKQRHKQKLRELLED